MQIESPGICGEQQRIDPLKSRARLLQIHNLQDSAAALDSWYPPPHPEPPRRKREPMTSLRRTADQGYDRLLVDLGGLLESARRTSARVVNTVMTATYWEMGRRIVEFEQGGEERAEDGTGCWSG